MSKKIVVTAKVCGGELNPFDASALEYALSLNDCEITVVTMGPLSNISVLENLTRFNLNAILISDEAFIGSDTIATSLALSRAIKELAPDYIFCGRQSVDGDTAQVPIMLAERLNYNFCPNVIDIKDDNIYFENSLLRIKDRTIYSIKKQRILRFPSIFSIKKEVEIINKDDLGLTNNQCGLHGSPTQVVRSYENNVGKRFCKNISYKDFDEVISNSLKKQKINKVLENTNKLNVVYFYGDILQFCNRVAKCSLEIKENKLDNIIDFIKQNKIENILFSDDDIAKEMACKLAIRLNTGLCADCVNISKIGDKMIMTRPAFGGNITADIVSKTFPALATIRTEKNKSNDIIFTIGNGAIPYIKDIKKLAEKYNAEVCASRIVVDKGYMPYKTQVGLTGKFVSSKVYICFGLSGAVQHTSAIENCDTIIAINNDKNARIFDYSDYGIIGNLENIFRR